MPAGLAAWLPVPRATAQPGLRVVAGALLIGQALLFVGLFAGTHGWLMALPHPVSMDYVSFYAAGVLAGQGDPALAYDRAAHFAMEQATLSPGIDYQFFLYPPPFLLVCAGLARLPWAVSFAVFDAATLLLCLAVLRATLGLPWRACLVPLLAFPAVPWVLLLGQNSFLTAGLFGAALLTLERRPVVAGLLFALLAGKPHFALLVPVALAAGGYWRAFVAAAAGVVALCAVATWAFGIGIWPAYLAYFSGAGAALQAGQVGRFGAMVTPLGALRGVGVPAGAALAVQAAAAVLAAWVVARLWRRRVPLPLRAAALLAGGLVAAPFGLFYDQMLNLVALCWLVRQGRQSGFPRGAQGVLALCWAVPLAPVLWLLWGMDQMPLGAVAAPTLLVLAVTWRRAAAGRA